MEFNDKGYFSQEALETSNILRSKAAVGQGPLSFVELWIAESECSRDCVDRNCAKRKAKDG